MEAIKFFGILYFLAAAFMYYLSQRGGQPPIIPGDIYIKKGPRTIYIPTGSSFIIAAILFLLLRKLVVSF
jgi:hypothetical protein